ncbi:MAG: DUF1822 family protein [Oscillatoriales cyanobacterium RM1_1_9]|nr:DUF1822 family protein [Oscillatoriales cyanobacterium SM2_3_0]NJO44468.1 DUF1822 family protein [Oscillatoriales cyanobacterium RM2_1_1]NJO71374.1 DUF1822 family protein [Oscillatoriales cyanobacterium RM1_1_9]
MLPHSSFDSVAIPLVIPKQVQALAEQFAAHCPDPSKARQIYHNTLAVHLVHNYFKILGIPSHLEAGNSWNPAVYLFHDVADLILPHQGSLECRAMLGSPLELPSRCPIPSPFQEDCLGYVLVQIDLETQTAAILGFVPVVSGEWLALADLRSPDELIAHVLSNQPQIDPGVDLRQWLQNQVDQGWAALENLMNPPSLSPARGVAMPVVDSSSTEAVASVLRLLEPDQPEEVRVQAIEVLGQIGQNNHQVIQTLSQLIQHHEGEELHWKAAITLGHLNPTHPDAGIRRGIHLPLGNLQVLLVVTILLKPENRLGVWLQVESIQPEQPLPPGLTLSVLTATGESRLQVTAQADAQGRGIDSVIGRRFTPPAGTCFQVQVQWQTEQIQTNFMA